MTDTLIALDNFAAFEPAVPASADSVELAALPTVQPTPAAITTATQVLAVPPPPATLGTLAHAGGSWTMIGSLLLVVGLILLLGRGVRALQGQRAGAAPTMRLRGSLQVGSRERVVWMQAGETHLLLGVSAGHVNNLHVFEVPPDFDQLDAQVPNSGAFANRLRQVLDRARQRAAAATAPVPAAAPPAPMAAAPAPAPAMVPAAAPAAARPARFRSAA